jgi:hypothetical protein
MIERRTGLELVKFPLISSRELKKKLLRVKLQLQLEFVQEIELVISWEIYCRDV